MEPYEPYGPEWESEMMKFKKHELILWIRRTTEENIELENQLHDTEKIYKKGFIDGITCYAWWKDGRQNVGTTGTTLKEAIKNVTESWNYNPV